MGFEQIMTNHIQPKQLPIPNRLQPKYIRYNHIIHPHDNTISHQHTNGISNQLTKQLTQITIHMLLYY